MATGEAEVESAQTTHDGNIVALRDAAQIFLQIPTRGEDKYFITT